MPLGKYKVRQKFFFLPGSAALLNDQPLGQTGQPGQTHPHTNTETHLETQLHSMPSQVTDFLGSAAFSQAVQALDIASGGLVCLKIIKNNKDYFDQSLDEIKLLRCGSNSLHKAALATSLDHQLQAFVWPSPCCNPQYIGSKPRQR